MRKGLLVILFVLYGALIRVVADEVKVTMKNGMAITGELVELVATDHITIVIAGVESTINVNDVASIEKVTTETSPIQKEKDPDKLVYGKYEILDTIRYPDSIVLKIENQELTMILIQGGWFNMGYDGRHSWALSSEPVHTVSLSSFYISRDLLSLETAKFLGFGKSDKDSPWWNTNNWDKAKSLVDSLQSKTQMELRLPTEAEWEYTTITQRANEVFDNTTNFEWCQDIYAPYSDEPQLNPQGAEKGSEHIRRSYNIPLHTRTQEPNITKWCRFINNIHYRSLIKGKNLVTYYPTCVRIAVSADQIQK